MSPRGGKGYLLTDDRVSGGTLQELNTLTCVHCNRVVALNPERERERGWCWKCDAYVCDFKVCIEECNPIQEGIELALKYPAGGPFLDRGPAGEILFNPVIKDQERKH